MIEIMDMESEWPRPSVRDRMRTDCALGLESSIWQRHPPFLEFFRQLGNGVEIVGPGFSRDACGEE